MESPPFRTTVWQRIRDAQAGSATAVNDLLLRYRPAIVGYLARRGVDRDECEDVAQEVLLALVDEGVLKRADPARGRFRSLLIAVTRNLLRERDRNRGRLKRGGDARALPLEAVEMLVTSAEEDEDFDGEWAKNLVRLAMTRLERHYPQYHAPIDLHLREDLSYRDIAERLGKTESVVRNGIHQGKLRLAEYLRAEIASYVSSASEFEEEKRRFLTFVSPEPA